jgi:hypothetical protein
MSIFDALNYNANICIKTWPKMRQFFASSDIFITTRLNLIDLFFKTNAGKVFLPREVGTMKVVSLRLEFSIVESQFSILEI